ncbi:SDR family NAD(P)-dependent oxidoreductase [Occultella kanbiaonis]|uniref:SDR family NAD(P)-dependent oxidoreductase n=1 Tax=Occultella kanbiaonis TaxID=2675754 RepID=UPI0012B86BBD|nr:SDR family NAD(P)-dependent oxidoreductase [Occultella kanbiaonis]
MRITPSSVALISGAASGLGEATARRLLADGAAVVLADLPTSRGAELADELGPRAAFAPTDVRDEAQVRAAVARAVELGELRVAVTCAGVATPGRILGRKGLLPLDAYRSVIEINLIGTFNVLRLAAEAMAGNEEVDGDRGVVVMTASVAAYDGQVGQAAYASSKGGVVALTLTAARDLAGLGIRVVTIAPGVMETPMMAGLPEETRTSLEALVPHPSRLGRPDEYAALAAHIVDNSLLNGEVIRLDGALRMPPR